MGMKLKQRASVHAHHAAGEVELLLALKRLKDSRKINEVKTKLVNEVSTTKLMKQGLVELIFKKYLCTCKFGVWSPCILGTWLLLLKTEVDEILPMGTAFK